jgi:hypothetical protein
LYFWSIIVTILGNIIQTITFLLKQFENRMPSQARIIICLIGWMMIVNGFSLVLWSRLHLVVNSRRFLRIVLYIIIVNGVVCALAYFTIDFGAHSRHRSQFIEPLAVIDKLEQTLFPLQEMVISMMYNYYTARFLNSGYPTETRKVVAFLLCVQVIAGAFDLLVIILKLIDLYTIKCMIHSVAYAIKLKLEFIVLNQLRQTVSRGFAPGLGSLHLSAPSKNDTVPDATGQECFNYSVPGLNSKGGAAVYSEDKGSQSSPGELKPELAGCQVQDDDELDLTMVIGKPDGDIPNDSGVNDLERQYLGRFQEPLE